jgi:nicotinate-nucleotide pyrophosphorylase (carboxylating)
MNPSPPDTLDAALVRARVEAALAEDAAAHDATGRYLELGDEPAGAEIRVDAAAVVCGVDVAREVFNQVDARIRFEPSARDGGRVEAKECLATVEGPVASILSAERTALNFLQRLCGVATLTARYVDAVRDTGTVILDTRKTTPLWRELEKYAVRCGGGTNHRRDLGAMILLKDNHVRAAGGMDALLRYIAAAPRARFVELEVDSVDALRDLLDSPAAAKIDRVMLDNFSPQAVGLAMGIVRGYRARGHRIEVEVSGGVTLETIHHFARVGDVDFISVGALTHSAVAATMSLELL